MSSAPNPSELQPDEFAIFIPTRSNEPLPHNLVPAFLGAIAEAVARSATSPEGLRIELVGFSQGSILAKWRIYLAEPNGQLGLAAFVATVLMPVLLSEDSGAAHCTASIMDAGNADSIQVVTRSKIEHIPRVALPAGYPSDARKTEEMPGLTSSGQTYEQIQSTEQQNKPVIEDGTLLILSDLVHIVTDPKKAPAPEQKEQVTSGFFTLPPSKRLSFIEDAGFAYAGRLHMIHPPDGLESSYLDRKVKIYFRDGPPPNFEAPPGFRRFQYIETVVFLD